MTPDECEPTITLLALKVAEMERRFDLHRHYEERDRAHTAERLGVKLEEMNRFRDENKTNTEKFATIQTLNERCNQLAVQIQHSDQMTEERASRNLAKIEGLEKGINEGIGTRVTILELNRSNFDGRLVGISAVIGALLIIFELVLHFWKP